MTTVTLTFKANQAGILKNIATLTSHEYPIDVQTTQKEVKPHLSVTITASPDPVLMANELHYKVVTELSPLAPEPTATDVELKLQLPEGTALKAVTTEQGTCDSSQYPTISCDLGNLSIETPASISRATVYVDVALIDAGLLVLTHEANVVASNYPADTDRERTKIYIPDDIKVDMALVLDTTHSMQQEINGTIAAVKQALTEIDPIQALTIALVTFKDEVRVEAFTTDLKVVLNAVSKLKAKGGGLCPEASAEAVMLAAQHVKAGGQILFATNASPYPDADIAGIIDLLKAKNIRFNALLTGDCTDAGSWNGLSE
ncbi:MAG: VWA domain-containing protein [Thioploca sp.]|nr:VWA domain-containing protein [Thioploca sp.]